MKGLRELQKEAEGLMSKLSEVLDLAETQQDIIENQKEQIKVLSDQNEQLKALVIRLNDENETLNRQNKELLDLKKN